MGKYVFSLIILLCISIRTIGQTDTEFWFSAPYISNQHGHLPVILQLSAYDQPASIQVSVPANNSFRTIVRTIDAYNSISVDLSRLSDQLINYPYNVVGNKGIFIKSNSYITASYEVLGYSEDDNVNVNSDVFVLKGKNALGNKFYTPFQTSRPNEHTYLSDAYSSFTIVATQNNTTVIITPTQDLLGHPKGIPFSLTLHQGETYACRALKRNGADHPSGSLIKSDKPIAVTVCDDSVVDSLSFDLLGDQIVPVDFIGTKYLIPAVPGASLQETYIIATENNTEIVTGNNSTSPILLDEGETYVIPMSENGKLIQSTHPVYVWHVASMNNEMAAAILPDIACNGSRSLIFTRNTLETFGIILIARSGSEDSFLLNGQAGIIRGEDFQAVEGSDDLKTLVYIPSLSVVPVSKVNRISNTKSNFQLGLITEDGYQTFRFGYYTSYNHLNLGPEQYVCPGESVTLDAGPDNDTYLWNTGANKQYITADSAGLYIVTVTNDTCSATDSVEIKYHEIPQFDLGGNITVCSLHTVILSGPSGNYDYYWSSGEREQEIKAEKTGQYALKVISRTSGCSHEDQLQVHFHPLPIPQIYFHDTDENLCTGEIIDIHTDNYPSIRWANGDSSLQTTVAVNETYQVTVTDSNNCQNSAERTLDCSPFIRLFNLITPNGDGMNDVFFIEGLHSQKYSLEVYNRWGAKVYFMDNYDNQWTPTELPDGIYYYSLTHRERNDLTFNGWFQVRR